MGKDHIPRWLRWINMAGGNSTPQVVEGPYTKMVTVDQYGRWQLFASSCGRTIYQDGYGGSIWPVATLRLKLWKDHIPRWLWWINMAGGNSSPQVVEGPYTKMVLVDQYGRWQLHAWIPWWIWWPMISNLVQILRTFLSC